jgi:hypothetical protein
MEHKLIGEGGEHWLPFARSRLTALRGLEHASQQFIMPDGAQVRVRRVGEHDYIRITASAYALQMDSGIVNLVNVGPNVAARYDEGILTEPSHVAAYTAPFSEVDSKGAFTNPGEGSTGQIAGSVRGVTTLRGKIPPGCPSFKPKDVEEGDPLEWVPSTDDDALYAKKMAAHRCPASIFTGRARLYAQAMYGLPLYHPGSHDALLRVPNVDTGGSPLFGASSVTEPFPVPTLDATGWPSYLPGDPLHQAETGTPQPVPTADAPSLAPSLLLPPYPVEGGSTLAVRMTTSSGVYLDPATGEHWLLNIEPAGLAAYPLISSPAGEALRQYLRTTGELADNPLGETDRAHLEAHILAYCLPHRDRRIVATGDAIAATSESMGYGWHWNWSGTTATIVDNEETLSGSDPVMESTRYTLTPTLTTTQTDDGPVHAWGLVFAVAEGPTIWAVLRAFTTICAPHWESNAMQKMTPRFNTPLFDCDAPFYAFYIGDELKVCRAAVTRHDADAAERIIDAEGNPNFAVPGYGMPIVESTVGLLGASVRDKIGFSDWFKVKLSCGSTELSDLYIGRVTSGQEIIVGGKSINPAVAVDPGGQTSGIPAQLAIDYASGYPNDLGVWATTRASGLQFPVSGQGAPCEYDRTVQVAGEVWTSFGIMAIPFGDAEAVFMRGYATYADNDNGTEVQHISNPNYIVRVNPLFITQVDPLQTHYGSDIDQYVSSNPGIFLGTVLSTTNPPDTSAVTELLNRTLWVGSAGAVELDEGVFDSLISDATEEVVSLELRSFSSPFGVAFSPSLFAAGTEFSSTPAAFVGWA